MNEFANLKWYKINCMFAFHKVSVKKNIYHLFTCFIVSWCCRALFCKIKVHTVELRSYHVLFKCDKSEINVNRLSMLVMWCTWAEDKCAEINWKSCLLTQGRGHQFCQAGCRDSVCVSRPICCGIRANVLKQDSIVDRDSFRTDIRTSKISSVKIQKHSAPGPPCDHKILPSVSTSFRNNDWHLDVWANLVLKLLWARDRAGREYQCHTDTVFRITDAQPNEQR